MTNRICQYIDHARRLPKTLSIVLATVLVSVFSILPASLASAATDQSDAATKAAPSAPKDSDNGVSGPVAAKGSQTQHSLAPALAYTVSLSATSTNLWPKQYSTLTAVSNQDVGPTPYYISIYDVTAASYIKICSSGTICSISATQPTAATHTYRAYVSGYPWVNPPANQQAISSPITVTWRGVSVSVTASPTTVGINGTSTLTATASADIGPSPFYIQVFDATTGARLKSCPFGTTCSVGTSKAVATTHKFLAYVSDDSTAFPPTGVQAVSNASYVTWTASNYRVSLGITAPTRSTRTLTAYSNTNVGPTPYFIEVFNLRTGARIALCGSGTSCSATVSLAFGKTDFAAFISSNSTALPPLNTQASSNIASATYFPIISPLDNNE